MGRPSINILGNRFGRLTVENKNPVRSLSGDVFWDCICDCGNRTTVTASNLVKGKTTSCGCYQKEKVKETITTHGMTNTTEFNIWRGIVKRCTNSDDKNYHNYGGRGITVNNRWLNSFEAFYEDMGPKPSPDHSIDRKENDKGYYKENCRWATRVEQQNNTRSNVFYTHNGVTKTIAEWSREYGIKYNSLYSRLIQLKWSFERAISTP